MSNHPRSWAPDYRTQVHAMGRRGVALVISGFLLLQVAWMITIPPFRGIDEIDHAYRAAAVADGDWIAGDRAPNGRGWLVEVPPLLVTAAKPQCAELEYYGPDNCAAVATADSGNVLIASAAAPYHPAFYWVIGTAASPFSGTGALYAMRVVASLMCLLFLGLAVWATARLPTRWPSASLLLGASPVFIYSTTLAAPNGLEMSAGLSLWASLLAISQSGKQEVDRQLLGIAIASAVLLGTLRLIGPLFVVLILLSVAGLQPRAFWAAVRRNKGMSSAGAFLVVVAVCGLVWWTIGPYALDLSGVEPDGPTSFDLNNLILWPLQSIAAFPLRRHMGALVVYPVVAAMVMTLVAVAVRRGTQRERIVLVATILVSLTLPVVFSLVTMKSVGVIWQGRYGLPYAAGAVLMAGLIIGRRIKLGSLPWKLTVPAMLGYLVAVLACLLKVRDVELKANAASISDPVWQAPDTVLLGGLVGLAMALFAVALSGRNRVLPGGAQSPPLSEGMTR